jgi:radical SAM-linked protein
MARRVPEGPPPPPVVQRIRLRYAKRGRLRFTSHRDFARAFERALRRAEVPMAYSAGFTPHPKISYVGASPTGVSSEAEYLEIGVAVAVDPERLRAALDSVLPDGLDIVEAVVAGPGSLPERMEASHWRLELPGVSREAGVTALQALLDRDEVGVERMTKSGRRTIDARSPILWAEVLAAPDADTDAPGGPGGAGSDQSHAILELVVRQVTPSVRPDDIVAALHAVADLALVAPPVAARLAQGPLDGVAAVGDPLAPDRAHATATP